MRQLTITTPEHVVIRLQPAGAGSRFLAVMIDSLITVGASGLLATLMFGTLPQGVAAAIFVTASFVLTWGWHVYFETRRNGRTPGKRALSLRVVDARGLPLTVYQSMVRNVARAVDFLPLFYGVGAAATLVNSSGRRLGDVIADTLVVREATPLVGRGDLTAERRHNTLRTPRVQRLIRHRIGLEEREFLLSLCLRAAKLAPEARYDLMEDVAAFYRTKLGLEEEPISGENFVRDLTALCYDGGTPASARMPVKPTKVNP
jgi:uncharacterized RDD family membrane protein YckC